MLDVTVLDRASEAAIFQHEPDGIFEGVKPEFEADILAPGMDNLIGNGLEGRGPTAGMNVKILRFARKTHKPGIEDGTSFVAPQANQSVCDH